MHRSGSECADCRRCRPRGSSDHELAPVRASLLHSASRGSAAPEGPPAPRVADAWAAPPPGTAAQRPAGAFLEEDPPPFTSRPSRHRCIGSAGRDGACGCIGRVDLSIADRSVEPLLRFVVLLSLLARLLCFVAMRVAADTAKRSHVVIAVSTVFGARRMPGCAQRQALEQAVGCRRRLITMPLFAFSACHPYCRLLAMLLSAPAALPSTVALPCNVAARPVGGLSGDLGFRRPRIQKLVCCDHAC